MQKRVRMKKKEKDVLSGWNIDESIDLYGIERWSRGMFSVNDQGHVCMRSVNDTPDVDLKSLVDDIKLRGLELPVLIRFTDVLRHRIAEVSDAFSGAMATEEYGGEYRPVYPIKVNQHRHVLEDIITHGQPVHMGLECGSKAELILAVAMHNDPEALLICNGFKDQEYIDIALTARRLGCRIFLVVEKFTELPMIIQTAKELDVDPLIGIRVKLASRGKGQWESSGGDRSKFGLTASEIIEAIKLLRRSKMLPHLQLMHSHIGSQITDIHRIKVALREISNMFVEMSRLGAPLQYLDVGGGLAVDYDGSHTNFESSANYDAREYAADVIAEVKSACNEADVPHPTIITETGRALVAHHSVLVVEAIAAVDRRMPVELPKVPKKAPEVVRRMRDVHDAFTGKNFQEIYHDAVEARREALLLFNLRHLSLEHRAIVEELFWDICRKILEYAKQLDYIPDDLDGLERLLSAIYFCNFSVFQSAPDHWAIKQLFPVAPLHRHTERPTRHAILADITCDSDGVIDRFVDLRDVKDTLSLHPLRKDEPYYLGVFLLGAYQEILGDLHNLFGDTNVVHVSSAPGGYVIDKTVEGERIEDVLEYVQFTRGEITSRFRERVENALRNGAMGIEQTASLVRRIDAGLETYTYLQTGEQRKTNAARRRR